MNCRAAKRILVADDYEPARELLCKILSQQGYQTSQARDGTEAYAMAHLIGPDLILLDVSMPGMDGYTTLEQMKGHPRTDEIPVVILSGLDWPYERKQALELGACAYLPKPVRVDELAVAVRRALHRKGRRNSRQLAASCQEY